MRRKLLWIAPLAILGMALFMAIGGEIVKQLWNWLLPPLLGWPRLTFWQALGMLVLCRILFRGFGFPGSTRSNMRRRMEARAAHLTPEERERCRQRLRESWGFAPSPGKCQSIPQGK